MRFSHLILCSAEVQQQFARILTPVLGPWPTVRTCSVEAVLSVLAYAAARVTSLADACLRLTHAPDSDTVLGHLARQLPSLDLLDRRVRDALVAHLPGAVRRAAG
jgi:hypothetical protein